MFRFTTLFFAIVLAVNVGMLAVTRHDGDGIYFLLSNEESQFSENLYYQPLLTDNARRHPVKAVNNAGATFNSLAYPENYWLPGDKWLYFPVYNQEQSTICLHRAGFTHSAIQRVACQNFTSLEFRVPTNIFTRSNDGNWFAYISSIPNNPQIWLTRSDGSYQKLILDGFDSEIVGLGWSPDDQWIYFMSITERTKPVQTTLHRIHIGAGEIDTLGTAVSRGFLSIWYWLNNHYLVLTDPSELNGRSVFIFNVDTLQIDHTLKNNASWFWDDQNEWLFYSENAATDNNREWHLFRSRLDGTQLQQITGGEQRTGIIALIEDNLLLVRTLNPATISTMKIDGNSITPIYEGDCYSSLFYEGWLYCVEGDGLVEEQRIFRVNLDGTVEILATLRRISYKLTLSPDGERIVVAAMEHENWGIFSMHLDGSDQRFLKTNRVYGSLFFTPLFDLRWHWQRLLLISLVLLSVSFRLRVQRNWLYSSSPAGTKQS